MVKVCTYLDPVLDCEECVKEMGFYQIWKTNDKNIIPYIVTRVDEKGRFFILSLRGSYESALRMLFMYNDCPFK